MFQSKTEELGTQNRQKHVDGAALPADVDHTLVSFILVIGIVGALAIVLLAAVNGRIFVAASIGVVALSIGVSLQSARRSAITYRQLNLTLGVVAVALALALFLAGMPAPPTIVMLSVLPFVMAAIGNRRGMIVWLIISTLILVGAYFHAPYVTAHYAEPPKDPIRYHYIIVGVLALFITSTAYALMGKRHKFLRDLSVTNQRLTNARDESRAANQAKSEFLGRMSHELRTPLNAILGFTELMSRDQTDHLTADQRQKVTYIQISGQRLLEIIDEILDITSHDARRTFMALLPTPLAPVISAAVREVEAAATLANIAVNIDTSAKGDVRALADSKSLSRVLSELIQNAIKFNRANGQIDISVETHRDKVQIHVADTGLGIPPVIVNNLFEPFNRSLPQGSDAASAGAGLGLTMARAIIEHMNGRISAESVPGNGSRFTIELDISRPLDNINIPQVRESPTFEKRRVVSPALPQIQEQNILYIEDNTLNQLVMTALISDLNLGQLHIAATGAEALALTPTLRPKLLLVDIHLPDCTGVELLSRIRAIDGCESIPAIAVSADAMPEHIDAALAGGFDHYLTKPVNIDSLSKAAARHLEIVTSPGTVASDNSSSEA